MPSTTGLIPNLVGQLPYRLHDQISTIRRSYPVVGNPTYLWNLVICNLPRHRDHLSYVLSLLVPHLLSRGDE